MAPQFQPKQLTAFKAEHLTELQGNVSETAIRYSLELLNPPHFSDGDVIHDNAAGSGAVMQTIMEQLPEGKKIQIDATDINPRFVEGCNALAQSHGWPVRAQVMPAQKLAFPNHTFTHSFTSFAFHCIDNPGTAAREIYRTLKPDGTAVVTIWTSMPHVDSLHCAHWQTRGRDEPMPTLLPLGSFSEDDLRAALTAGGFENESVRFFGKDCFLKVPDLKRFAQLNWSLLGAVPAGWNQNDEDRWDEAISIIVEHLKSGNGISQDRNSETVLKFVACIAIAKK